MKKTILFIFLYFVFTPAVVIGLFYGVFIIMKAGLEAHEIQECIKWQEHAKEFQGFYITNWQDEQCRSLGFPVDAPVRK